MTIAMACLSILLPLAGHRTVTIQVKKKKHALGILFSSLSLLLLHNIRRCSTPFPLDGRVSMHRSRGRRDGWEKRKTRANYGRAKRGRMQGLRFRENALSKSGNKGG